ILVQRSTSGVQVVAAIREADIFAASLVVARATVQACLLRKPATLTLIASADHPEDHACAQYMEGLIRGGDRDDSDEPDIDQLLEPLRASDRYRRVMTGA